MHILESTNTVQYFLKMHILMSFGVVFCIHFVCNGILLFLLKHSCAHLMPFGKPLWAGTVLSIRFVEQNANKWQLRSLGIYLNNLCLININTKISKRNKFTFQIIKLYNLLTYPISLMLNISLKWFN